MTHVPTVGPATQGNGQVTPVGGLETPHTQEPLPSQSSPTIGHVSLLPFGNGVQAGVVPVVQRGQLIPPLLDEFDVELLEDSPPMPPLPAVPPDEPDEDSDDTCSSGAQAGKIGTSDKTMMPRRMKCFNIVIQYAGAR
jgi:hypothetical protein